MIFGAEIALLVLGIMALAKGRMVLTKTRVVQGVPARLLGAIALLPLPVSFGISFVIGLMMGLRGVTVTESNFRGTAILIEVCVLLSVIALIYGIGWRLATDPATEGGTPPLGGP